MFIVCADSSVEKGYAYQDGDELVVGLYIEQICLAGLFFLATDSQGRRSSIAQGVMMVILFAITLASHVLFVHSYGRECCWNSNLEDDLMSAFKALTRNLPTVLSTKKIQDRWERKQRGDHQILPDLFNRESRSRGIFPAIANIKFPHSPVQEYPSSCVANSRLKPNLWMQLR